MLALLLLVAACGDGDDEASPTSDTDGATTATASSATTDGATTSTASTSTTGTTASGSATTTGTATTSTTTDKSTLPGEEFIGYVENGDVLGVVGVPHDDVLNIRALPGPDQQVVTTVEPTDIELLATGRARWLDESIWFEVRSGGVTGWANSRFLGHVDGTDDVTAAFLADYGEAPEAETLTELGELVAAEFASEDPASRIVLTVAPSVGDLGEVTYDVIGLGDDSTLGYRLHLFATEGAGGESFVLRTIERTTFCIRGTAGDICT